LIDEDTIRAVKDRSLVSDVAASDNHYALQIARQIRNPWYRCQSLAWVARFAPHGEFDDRIDEALAACFDGANPYKCVAVSAWPLRALIEREQTTRLAEFVPKLMKIAETIDHPVSRMDALGSLLDGVFPAGDPYRRTVFEAYASACEGANSWKAGRGLAGFALRFAPIDPGLARSIIESMRDSQYKRRAMRELATVRDVRTNSYFR
jgi:hypothetical protein